MQNQFSIGMRCICVSRVCKLRIDHTPYLTESLHFHQWLQDTKWFHYMASKREERWQVGGQLANRMEFDFQSQSFRNGLQCPAVGSVRSSCLMLGKQTHEIPNAHGVQWLARWAYFHGSRPPEETDAQGHCQVGALRPSGSPADNEHPCSQKRKKNLDLKRLWRGWDYL